MWKKSLLGRSPSCRKAASRFFPVREDPEITRRKPGSNFEFELVFGDLIRYKPTGDKQRDIQVVCQMCATALEKLILEQPEQWLWAPRHWLDINRRQAAQYKDWTPPVKLS